MSEIESILGPAGRMISLSKSDYFELHPDHVVVFNGNVCVGGEKCWYGDLDLTLDEPLLRRLAAGSGEQVAVLLEQDARFESEHVPRLERAVLVIDPDDTTHFDKDRCERAHDGTLRARPPATTPKLSSPVTPFDWDGTRRPRLLRFWRLEHKTTGGRVGLHEEHAHLLYVGRRDLRKSPLLVLGCFHWRRPHRYAGIEVTWYPSLRPYRRHPLLHLLYRRKRGRVQPYLRLMIQPGFAYVLEIGAHLQRS